MLLATEPSSAPSFPVATFAVLASSELLASLVLLYPAVLLHPRLSQVPVLYV